MPYLPLELDKKNLAAESGGIQIKQNHNRQKLSNVHSTKTLFLKETVTFML